MKVKDYTIRLMRHAKVKGEPDECAAEIDVTGVTATMAEMAAHYTKFGKAFMRHIRFDYATARAA